MTRIPSPAEELDNRKVNRDARAIWEECLAQPEFADVSVIWCYSAGSGSDHRNGRCCDFMVTHTDRSLTDSERHAMGTRIVNYFIRNSVRLNVQGIIFYGHVWGFPETRELGTGAEPHVTYRGPSGTARVYTMSDQHHDHVHVQVNGAPARSWINPKETDDMPTPEELWGWDHATPPDYISAKEKKENPSWKPKSLLTEACQQAHEAGVKVDKLEEKVDNLTTLLEKIASAVVVPSDPTPATDPAKKS